MRLATLAWPGLALLVAMPFAGPASAAPMRMAPQAESGTSLATPVACRWRNGARVCKRYGYRHVHPRYGRYYGYGPTIRYGAPSPESLRFGSTEWWRAMDREGRGGYRR
jgi:hypothetical protein